MGRNDRSIADRSHDPLNAQRALRRILPALKRAATSPEKYTQQQRLTIVRLLEVAILADDAKLSLSATEVVVAMEGENQQRGQEPMA